MSASRTYARAAGIDEVFRTVVPVTRSILPPDEALRREHAYLAEGARHMQDLDRLIEESGGWNSERSDR